jgi:hypothetical protein
MPDHHDANLIVQLAQWSATAGIDEAVSTLFSEDFDAETASASDPAVRKALQFYETIGTLTKNGLLDQGLVLDWLYAKGIWQRVGPAAKRLRQEAGVPELYENFEALAAAQE